MVTSGQSQWRRHVLIKQERQQWTRYEKRKVNQAKYDNGGAPFEHSWRRNVDQDCARNGTVSAFLGRGGLIGGPIYLELVLLAAFLFQTIYEKPKTRIGFYKDYTCWYRF